MEEPFFTTREVARHYRISTRRVTELARIRGLVPRRIGQSFIWTAEQRDELKPNPVGRPKNKR